MRIATKDKPLEIHSMETFPHDERPILVWSTTLHAWQSFHSESRTNNLGWHKSWTHWIDMPNLPVPGK